MLQLLCYSNAFVSKYASEHQLNIVNNLILYGKILENIFGNKANYIHTILQYVE